MSEVSTTGHLWYNGHVAVLGVHADSSSLEAGDWGQGQCVSKGCRRREGKGVLGKGESLVGLGTRLLTTVVVMSLVECLDCVECAGMCGLRGMRGMSAESVTRAYRHLTGMRSVSVSELVFSLRHRPYQLLLSSVFWTRSWISRVFIYL